MLFPKYYSKLFLFNFLLAAATVSLVSVVIYGGTSRIVQKKVNESNIDVLTQTRINVEQTLKTVEQVYIHFVQSPIVSLNIKNALTYRDFVVTNEICEVMKGLQTHSYAITIDNAYLINIDEDWVITSKGLSSFKSKKNTDKIFEYLEKSETFLLGD